MANDVRTGDEHLDLGPWDLGIPWVLVIGHWTFPAFRALGAAPKNAISPT